MRVKLAFGGVFASLNAQLVKRQCPEVDFVCRGDGEQLCSIWLDQLDDPAGCRPASPGRTPAELAAPQRQSSAGRATSTNGRFRTARV